MKVGLEIEKLHFSWHLGLSFHKAFYSSQLLKVMAIKDIAIIKTCHGCSQYPTHTEVNTGIPKYSEDNGLKTSEAYTCDTSSITAQSTYNDTTCNNISVIVKGFLRNVNISIHSM